MLTNMLSRTPTVKKALAEADSARDSHQWAKAAELYEEYLEKNPDNFNITVQLANCLKEAGQYQEALNKYKLAISLNPNNSDVHLQRGHALKVAGRKLESVVSYREAYSLDSNNHDALSELINFGEAINLGKEVPIKPVELKAVYLDITDLIEYAKQNTSLSGIQRVVANLASHAKESQINGYRVVPIIPEYDRFRILAANSALVDALIRIFDLPNADHHQVNKSIDAIYASRYEVVPGPDDVMVVAGAFWIYSHYDCIARLRQTGMRFGVFIHDLIQIKNPEYVHLEAVEVFQKKLVDILSVSDFVLTNSQFVADEVRAYIAEQLNFSIPVRAVPLATELRNKVSKKSIVNQDIFDACQEEFVLCVCTIEVRKNHLYLVKIWEKLRAKYGDKVPNLIFVGKWGWDIDELKNYLDKKGYVGDWLHIFNGISDSELEYIYERCLFTAYTSFAEGFGLPIGESLAHGKPCIASNTTSMPEVGGTFARYVDPFSIEDGYRVFEQALTDRKDLARWEKTIAENFKIKSWNEFCIQFYDEITTFHSSQRDTGNKINCILPSVTVVEGGDIAIKKLAESNSKIITFRAARRSGWSHMESWGVWSTSRRATLEFASDQRPGTDVLIYLRLSGQPESKETRAILRCGTQETGIELSPKQRFVTLKGSTNEQGHIRIDLIAQGLAAQETNRSLFIALSALAYCRLDKPLERIELLEKVTLF